MIIDPKEKVVSALSVPVTSPDRPTSVPESDDSSFEMNSDPDSGDATSLKSGNAKNQIKLLQQQQQPINDSDDTSFQDVDDSDEDDMEILESSGDDREDYDSGEDMYDDDSDAFGDDQAGGDDDNDFLEDLAKQRSPKPYETQFRVLTSAQLHTKQLKLIDHVASFLSVPQSQAKALLWSNDWRGDSLIEAYIDHSAKILEKAGLVVDSHGNPVSNAPYRAVAAPSGYMCFICCEDTSIRPDKAFLILSLECGHSLCIDCFRSYTHRKVSEEGESRQILCPQFKCKLYLPEDAVRYMFSETETNLSATGKRDENEIESDKLLLTKYEEFLEKDCVAQMERVTFCPAPDCKHIIECLNPIEDVNRKVPTVTCTCGNAFCFSCGLDDHMPATCVIAKAWLKKCRDDSETSNWIAANTQECNKCHSTIEKNGGCNHMTCKKCKHEFCWICMGDWSLHGNSYYNCSRYNESDAMTARTEQDRSRAQLKRYLHYYNRYMNHLHSLKLDSETFEQMQKKMKQMQESANMSWIEVQFLSQAFDVLSASRHTLTWTYAFAFYLQKAHRTQIFEDNQNDLEVAVEQLSELFEKPANDLASLKVQLLDKCQYVSSRRVALLEDAAQGLMEGTWKYLPFS